MTNPRTPEGSASQPPAGQTPPVPPPGAPPEWSWPSPGSPGSTSAGASQPAGSQGDPHGRYASTAPPPGPRAYSVSGSSARQANAGSVGEGIVALHPLDASTVLEGAFRFLRANPQTSLGMSAAVYGVVTVLTAVWGVITVDGVIQSGAWEALIYGFEGGVSSGSTGDQGAIASFMVMIVGVGLVQLGGQAILSTMLSGAVGQAVLGRKPTWGWLWGQSRPVLLWVMLAQVLSFVVLALGLAVAVAITAVLFSVSETLAFLMLLLLIPVALGTAVSYPGYLAVLTPSIMFERIGPLAGMRRALGMVIRSFWRLVLVALLAAILVSVASSVMTMPFQIVSTIMTMLTMDSQHMLGGPGDVSMAFLVSFGINLFGGFVASVFTAPFLIATNTLQYLDHRMRYESLDVHMLSAAHSGR